MAERIAKSTSARQRFMIDSPYRAVIDDDSTSNGIPVCSIGARSSAIQLPTPPRARPRSAALGIIPSPMPIISGTRLGEYEILNSIGAGGMGEVYKARDATLERDVAIKVLPPSLSNDEDRLRRFVQEAQAAAALNHPNILAIYHIGTHDHSPFIVSELLTGSTLRTVLGGGPVPVRKASEYGIQIARGLAAAHDRGIVHRDLKPDNVFITDDGRVKLLDFGIAKLMTDSADAADRTKTVQTGVGTVLGTVGYMSPEQLRGEVVDARADVFSLGAVLYEMLSGRRAFQKNSGADTVSAVLHDDPPELAGTGRPIPPVLDRIVRRALEKQPQERFQSARDVAFALEDLSSSSAHHAIPVEAREPSSRLWLAAAAVGVMALAVGASAMVLRRSTRPAAQPIFQPVTFRRGTVLTARFAPDGQTIIYGATWDGHRPETFAAGSAGPESRSLGVPNTDIYSISSRGELALSVRSRFSPPPTAGILEEMPLLGGAAPRQIHNDVEYADWAPDGSMAVTLDTGLGDRLEYPIGTPLYAVDGPIHMIRVSPDGSRVAFMESSDRGATVATIDRTKHITALTSGWLSVSGLAWTPSGSEIWFAAKSENEGWGIYSVPQAGGAVRVVERMPGPCRLHDLSHDGRALVSMEQPTTGIRFVAPGSTHEEDLSWLDRSQLRDLSSDAQSILFTETGEGVPPAGAIYVRKTDGSPAVQLGSGLAFAFSPNGQWVLAATRSGGDLSLIPTGPGTAQRLKGDSTVTTGRFLRDGKGVVFIGLGKDKKLYVSVQALDGEPRVISPGGEIAGLVVSPEGTTIATTIDRKACLLTVSGAPLQPLAWSGYNEIPIAWSSDGKALFMAKREDPTQPIDRVEIATGARAPWKALVPSDGAGVSNVLAVRVLDDGRSYAYSYERELSQLLVVSGLR